MNLISDKGYKNASVNFLKIKKTGELWIKIDVGDGLGVKNISNFVL